jgi:hypothetical protein
MYKTCDHEEEDETEESAVDGIQHNTEFIRRAIAVINGKIAAQRRQAVDREFMLCLRTVAKARANAPAGPRTQVPNAKRYFSLGGQHASRRATAAVKATMRRRIDRPPMASRDLREESAETEERTQPLRVLSVYDELLRSPRFAGGCIRAINSAALRTVCRLAGIELSRDDYRERSRIKSQLERHADGFRDRCRQDARFVWSARLLVTWQTLPTLLAQEKRPGSRSAAVWQRNTEGLR